MKIDATLANYHVLGIRSSSPQDKEIQFKDALQAISSLLAKIPDSEAASREDKVRYLLTLVFDASLENNQAYAETETAKQLQTIREAIKYEKKFYHALNPFHHGHLSAAGHKLLAALAIYAEPSCLNQDGHLNLAVTKNKIRSFFSNGASIDFDHAALRHIGKVTEKHAATSASPGGVEIQFGRDRYTSVHTTVMPRVVKAASATIQAEQQIKPVVGELVDVKIDLSKPPKANPQLLQHDFVAIGDCHGRAMLALAQLVEAGTIGELSQADFDRVKSSIEGNHLTELSALFNEVIVAGPRAAKLTLLDGDLFGDRFVRGTDYASAMLLSCLTEKGINWELNVGDHDIETIIWFLQNEANEAGANSLPYCGRERQTDPISQQDILRPIVMAAQAASLEGLITELNQGSLSGPERKHLRIAFLDKFRKNILPRTNLAVLLKGEAGTVQLTHAVVTKHVGERLFATIAGFTLQEIQLFDQAASASELTKWQSVRDMPRYREYQASLHFFTCMSAQEKVSSLQSYWQNLILPKTGAGPSELAKAMYSNDGEMPLIHFTFDRGGIMAKAGPRLDEFKCMDSSVLTAVHGHTPQVAQLIDTPKQILAELERWITELQSPAHAAEPVTVKPGKDAVLRMLSILNLDKLQENGMQRAYTALATMACASEAELVIEGFPILKIHALEQLDLFEKSLFNIAITNKQADLISQLQALQTGLANDTGQGGQDLSYLISEGLQSSLPEFKYGEKVSVKQDVSCLFNFLERLPESLAQAADTFKQDLRAMQQHYQDLSEVKRSNYLPEKTAELRAKLLGIVETYLTLAVQAQNLGQTLEVVKHNQPVSYRPKQSYHKVFGAQPFLHKRMEEIKADYESILPQCGQLELEYFSDFHIEQIRYQRDKGGIDLDNAGLINLLSAVVLECKAAIDKQNQDYLKNLNEAQSQAQRARIANFFSIDGAFGKEQADLRGTRKVFAMNGEKIQPQLKSAPPSSREYRSYA